LIFIIHKSRPEQTRKQFIHSSIYKCLSKENKRKKEGKGDEKEREKTQEHLPFS
jgi:hypothetical protein